MGHILDPDCAHYQTTLCYQEFGFASVFPEGIA
jgi:hypothetical protein